MHEEETVLPPHNQIKLNRHPFYSMLYLQKCLVYFFCKSRILLHFPGRTVMFSAFHISYSPAVVRIAQVTKGSEGVNLEKLATVSTYESVLKLLLLGRLEGFLH